MIVDPDFVDHWKTRMLVDLLGNDEVAPVYVIRLWAHCQQRREWRFDPLPTAALKAICRYRGDADEFEGAMLAAGFIAREGLVLTAVGWDEYNASLIANWENGKKGGRPKKQPSNPSETHGFPTDNRQEAHGEASGGAKPNRLDEIGEEKRREEKAVRASRLPADWQPSFEEIQFCRTERPDLNPDNVASQFRDYWIAQPGAKGRKADWMATWRNWVRNQRGGAPKGAASAAAPRQQRNDRSSAAAGIFSLPNFQHQEVIDV